MRLLRHLPIFSALSLILFSGWPGISSAQRSKHGALVVSTANNIINEYTNLTASAAAGATQIKVTASSLNANSRFPSPLAPGDLLMIIQIQGATTLGALNVNNDATNVDSTWGAITNYNNCGNWEFAEVLNVPDNTTIDLSCPLKNSYAVIGNTEIVRVPRYSTLTINAGGSITCTPWNGTFGGVCAIEVEGNSTINGSIQATGTGFRGGQVLDNTTQLMNLFFSASTLNQDGAEKGEGIAGYQGSYNTYGGRYMRGAPGNGGGGGNIHNGGGGGGANGGNPAAWNGHGIPDNSVAGYSNAWNLQYAGFSSQVSSGGGQGGYSWSANKGNPTTQQLCNNGIWGGQSRCPIGGYGGRPLDYSTGRLFLGGGGGAGDQNDNSGGSGSNGGGLIFLMNYGLVSGTGQLISNGKAGGNTVNLYKDGAGGGGGGGTIVVNSIGAITGISISANGGKGGDQIFSPTLGVTQAQGPGGGGGGGYVAISNGAPAISVAGGINGITNSPGVNPEFPPNGATKGGDGTNVTTLLTSIVLNAPNVTICAGQAATLTSSLGGNPPAGTSVIWYDAPVGGNILPSTGGTLTTSVITTAGTYTYYVGSCPGTYHLPVLVTVSSFPLISVSPNTTLCNGGSITLTAGGATTYTWSPTASLSNPTISNPVANPAATTTYVVAGITPCGIGTDTVVVTVQSELIPTISGNTSICAGGTASLTASGGTNYVWSTGSSNTSITVAPSTNTTYTLNAVNGSCIGTTSVTVSVISNLTAAIVPGNTTICPGSAVTLTGSGGSTYSWSTTETTASITVAPTSTTSYSVTIFSGICSNTASVTLTVANNPSSTIIGPTNICAGGNATLSAFGGETYVWSTAETTAAITVTPTGSTTYSVIVSTGSCKDSAYITTNVSPNPVASAFSNGAIIAGQSTGLTASGGTTYLWDNGMTGASISVAPLVSTVYCVTVLDAANCVDTACVLVAVEKCPETLYLPNAFSPNGDGENDVLQIYYGLPACIRKFHLVIYNRWGEKILDTTDSQFQWDGTYKGLILGQQTGGTEVYSYWMKAELQDGTSIFRKGNISLLR